jgi:hypothetical protein
MEAVPRGLASMCRMLVMVVFLFDDPPVGDRDSIPAIVVEIYTKWQ